MARKTKEEALETREKLMSSALEMMSENPFSSVSMNEIAERVGLSKGATYWHFKTKNDLLITLFENMCRQVEKELYFDGGFPKSWNEVGLYYKRKMEKASQNGDVKKMYKLILRREEWPEEVRVRVNALLKEKLEEERKMLENLLLGTQKGEDFRSDISPRTLSTLVAAVFHGLFVSQLDKWYPLNFTKYIDFILHSLTDAR